MAGVAGNYAAFVTEELGAPRDGQRTGDGDSPPLADEGGPYHAGCGAVLR